MAQPRASQISALTGIRIIAALWVVVEHFRNVIFGLFPATRASEVFVEAGYLGVEVFFVLSGFIISHNYAAQFSKFSFSGYRKFLQKRLARLYPVHVATLGIASLLVAIATIFRVNLNFGEKYDPLSFVMNLLMLQALPPAQAWNGPAWSISAEAAAYLFFPALALCIMRVTSRAALLTLTGTGLALVIIGHMYIEADQGFQPTGYFGIWIRILGEFTAGCFLWRFWILAVVPSRKYDLLALMGLAGVIGVLAWSDGIGARNFLALPFVALFILGCAGATGPLRRFLSTRYMDYGGRISYSLYMIHFLVLMIGGKVLPWEQFTSSHWTLRLSVLLTYFAVSFVGAGLLYRFVEEPGRRFVAKLGSRTEPKKQRKSIANIMVSKD